MARQLAFDLPARPALGRDEFFVAAANAQALDAVEDWANWPSGKLLISGPPGSGKTHLTMVWAAASDATVLNAANLARTDIAAVAEAARHIAIENIEEIAGAPNGERALFHLHNLVLGEDGHLLMSASEPMPKFDLPDLQSRVDGTLKVRLEPPDDALLAAVLVKLFSDRQIDIPAAVVNYLSKRIERSLADVAKLVSALDEMSLSEKRPITVKLAARVLDQIEKQSR